MRLKPDSFAFTLFLAAIGALSPLAIDMGLPALSAIGRSLDIRPAIAGLTLSVFMAGFAIGPLAAGPLSDRLGRKRLLLTGLVLFAIGGLAAAASPSIGWLLVARALQGVGGGSNATLAYAIIRDLFEGRAAHRRIASVAVVSTTAPMIAPSLGALVLGVASWRAIYGITGVLALAVIAMVMWGLTETLPPTGRRRGLLLPQLVQDVISLNHNRTYLLHSAINALGFAALFSYVSGSPLIVLGLLKATQATYAMLFAATSFSIIAGAFVNGQLAVRLAVPARMLGIGTLLALAADLALLALTLAHWITLPRLVPLLLLANFAFGLIAPSAAHGALEPVPRQAGVASGLLTTTQMVCGSFGSALVSALFPRFGILAVTGPMLLFALLAAGAWLLLQRTREPDRGVAPG
ncbi:multidrug effflux MFS transporter [Lichenicola sp.]|uniref:multidrug effflux MFS transporter n=1 Tax=Lichenicola sp. TaxID=2804529 RepID=UPI003AFF8C99